MYVLISILLRSQMVETTMEYREDVIIKLKLSLLELNEEI
jgi:hypothetical protein